MSLYACEKLIGAGVPVNRLGNGGYRRISFDDSNALMCTRNTVQDASCLAWVLAANSLHVQNLKIIKGSSLYWLEIYAGTLRPACVFAIRVAHAGPGPGTGMCTHARVCVHAHVSIWCV